MVCCSLYPSSSSHIASRPYGHKTGTQSGKDWNIKFKKHLRTHQITLFQDKKSKNFLGRGHSPLPRRHPKWGGGHPLHPAPRAPTAPRLRLKDDLCFRLLLGPAARGLNRDQIVKVARFTGCKNFVGKRKKFIFNEFHGLAMHT